MIIKAIEESDKVDALFLDHDLGGEVYVDSSRKDCGMEVVRFIVENKPKVSQIIVHTLNQNAGINMTNQLRNAGYEVKYIPFLYFTQLLVNQAIGL
jgi:hypothetical protein